MPILETMLHICSCYYGYEKKKGGIPVAAKQVKRCVRLLIRAEGKLIKQPYEDSYFSFKVQC